CMAAKCTLYCTTVLRPSRSSTLSTRPRATGSDRHLEDSMVRVAAYQPGIYPRSEGVVAATRGLERGRTSAEDVASAFRADLSELVAVQRQAGLDLFSDGLLRWQDIFRPLVEASPGMDARTLVRWFDNNSFFRAPEVTGPISMAGSLPAVLKDDDAVPAPRVATLPSPYLFSRAAHTDLD